MKHKCCYWLYLSVVRKKYRISPLVYYCCLTNLEYMFKMVVCLCKGSYWYTSKRFQYITVILAFFFFFFFFEFISAPCVVAFWYCSTVKQTSSSALRVIHVRIYLPAAPVLRDCYWLRSSFWPFPSLLFRNSPPDQILSSPCSANSYISQTPAFCMQENPVF